VDYLFQTLFKMKKKLIYLTPILLIAVVFILLSYNKGSLICDRFSLFQGISYSGVVVQKFIDRENHAYPTVIIKDSSDVLVKINLMFDTNNVYDAINIGDTIQKVKGVNFFVRNSIDTLIVDYGENCDSVSQ